MSLETERTITELVLKSKSAADTKQLILTLPRYPDLKFLSMEWCEVNAEITDTLGSMLSYCHKLQTLYLYVINIGDEYSSKLIQTLPVCTNLHHLYLVNVCLGRQGMLSLANALPGLPYLQTLDLGDNQIDSSAIGYFAVLLLPDNLQDISLRGNRIDDNGAQDLALFLNRCHNLQRLELSSNQIRAKGGAQIYDALESCKYLLSAYIDHDSMEEKLHPICDRNYKNLRELFKVRGLAQYLNDAGICQMLFTCLPLIKILEGGAITPQNVSSIENEEIQTFLSKYFKEHPEPVKESTGDTSAVTADLELGGLHTFTDGD